MSATNLTDHELLALLVLVALVAVVLTGLSTGKATLVYRTYKKSEDPELYWAGIILPSLCIVGIICGFFFR